MWDRGFRRFFRYFGPRGSISTGSGRTFGNAPLGCEAAGNRERLNGAAADSPRHVASPRATICRSQPAIGLAGRGLAAAPGRTPPRRLVARMPLQRPIKWSQSSARGGRSGRNRRAAHPKSYLSSRKSPHRAGYLVLSPREHYAQGKPKGASARRGSGGKVIGPHARRRGGWFLMLTSNPKPSAPRQRGAAPFGNSGAGSVPDGWTPAGAMSGTCNRNGQGNAKHGN